MFSRGTIPPLILGENLFPQTPSAPLAGGAVGPDLLAGMIGS